ncbi:MAG: AAA family ATPase [Alphaproteobacteria bacterium]|nr:AAA family ATPase [Alphaproteobacteria bacterium]
MKKILYIIAGPNGSGKTTLAHELVKDETVTFLNADEIAEKHNDGTGLLSGRILLEKFDKLIDSGKSIVLESTVSGNYHNRVIERARKAKYEIIFIYIFLSSVEQNIQRIKHRVAMGGHNVPSPDVRRRYVRSMKNFKDVISKVNYWELYYNGENNYELVARGTGEILDITDDALYNKFNKGLI